jgi:hypothetical protein
MYSVITKDVVNHFKLEAASKLIKGLDELFQNYKLGEYIVGLEWDIWSGHIVTAKNNKAESLVNEIAVFIDAKYK